MTNFVYNKISFFLLNLATANFLTGLFLNIYDSSFFIEWVLGGAVNEISCTFLLDYKALLFSSVVLFISANVVIYSKSYMSEDFLANRFIFLVFGFILSMMLLIFSPNIISILLGWDGLGLVSYCLVIYYPTKKSNGAGMITVLSNRVGDVCILLSIAWFSSLGDYSFMCWGGWVNPELYLLLLITFGAMTKSAQLPFSAWLPAAMAAPTPVSALVHSSTLVTAGVYLLIRFNGFFTDINESLFVLSTLTMFMSGLVATFEYDLKKIIALSTLSQLAVMMFSISMGLFDLAFFHLIIHALFKALLFLSAGAMIHGVGGTQDIRFYGGSIKNFPVIAVCLNYANLSLCGFPFLAGFYSKDLIIEMACQGYFNQLLLMFMFIAVGLTVAYSLRLTFLAFVSSPNAWVSSFVYDTEKEVFIPIVVLTISSLISGSSLMWLTFKTPSLIILPFLLKMLTLVVIFLGGVVAYSQTYENPFNKTPVLYKMSFFLGSLWFLPQVSGQFVVKPALGVSQAIIDVNEMGWIEELTMLTVYKSSSALSSLGEYFQLNQLKSHLLLFTLWALVSISLML
nr:NADH dehydrogenase subunit 5 [Sida crystallina]